MLDGGGSEPYPARHVGDSHPSRRPEPGRSNRRPSIFFLAADHGGAGRTRSFFPAKALAATGWRVAADTRASDPGRHDVVVIHRPYRASHLAFLRAHQQRGGVALVQEDDDLSVVQAGGVDKRIKRLYTDEVIRRHDTAIAEADGLIVSTPKLEQVYGPMARRTWLVRNYLPRWIGEVPREKPRDGKVRVVWGGRVTTHQAGLEWLRKVSPRMLDGAVFLAVGDGMRTSRHLGVVGEKEVHPFQTDARRYYSLLSRGDIAIVALDPRDPLNEAKSALKGLEALALGQPVVAAETPEYLWLREEAGPNGGVWTASDPETFADLVQALVTDDQLREASSVLASQTAERLWLEDHLAEWEVVFDAVSDLRRASRGGVPDVRSGVLPRSDGGAPVAVPVLPRATDRHRVEVSDRPTVAVAMPSRGTMHSRTVEALLVSLEKSKRKAKLVDSWWSFAHGEPIPDSHEAAAARALATGAELVWFVEEDNVPPAEALVASIARMRETGAGVVAVPYPVGEPRPAGDGTRWNTVYTENGEVLFTGLGITLVHRDVFERLARPWFRTDRQPDRDWRLTVKTPYVAGGVDVSFGLRVREAGFALESVPNMVGAHIRTVKRGERPFNRSPHEVEIWDTIQRDQHLFRGRDKSRFVPPKDWRQEFRNLRPWVGKYYVGGRWCGNVKPDAYDPVHDPRLGRLREAFDGVPAPRSVLELGALEGGHSVALAEWVGDGGSVVALEGREQNLRRARLVLTASEVENVELRQADLEAADLAAYGAFDLVFSIGVLYHMTDPMRLLHQMAAAAPRLFLWTHHSERDPSWTYQEGGMDDPLSGLSPTSTWLGLDVLMQALRGLYDTVTILESEPRRKPRPAVLIAASRDGRGGESNLGDH